MILLDDVQSGTEKRSSRLYQGPIAHWTASTPTEVNDCFSHMESALQAGQYLVCLVAYEYGEVVHRLPSRSIEDHPQATSTPLIQAWAFAAPAMLSKVEVDNWLAKQLSELDVDKRMSGVADCANSITKAQFQADVERIQEWIRCGDTYQINHTYRVTGQIYGDPLALYTRLRVRQPGRYGAFIQEANTTILSQSPELFVERTRDCLRAMPMNGTASAQTESAEQLASDPKNRAENIMIVDLLRNDLSRIAIPGSVTVPDLFQVRQHGNVLQMTSTIEAKAQPNLSLRSVFGAVFPCGSVTGAPKKRSMEIIRALEPAPRDYYCGALGWFDPNGDFAFSVPIRTLSLDRELPSTPRQFTLGIGAGITIDSDAEKEWQECQIKSAFITEMPSELGLFETIRVENKKLLRYAAHLERLKRSARALQIPYLAHKVTHRTAYDLAWNAAVARGGFDTIFLNEAGFVKEGGCSSIFILPRGSDEWITPPLSAGVLPGILRQSVLADPSWQAREANFKAADVLAAERIVVCNALRGALPAVLKVG
jgi:para-aminobenzoate synthetase/4-amino-4-deoxychorismate lyase